MKQPKLITDTLRQGVVITHYGASCDVEETPEHIFRCHLRKNAAPVITGDQVLWQLEKDNTGTISQLLPRRSLLVRPEARGRSKAIAANIDLIVIVSAPPPALSEYLIDRYLIAAEYNKLPAVIVLNKIDLLNEKSRSEIETRLNIYATIGYQVLLTCSIKKHGLDALQSALQGKNAVLVGASGVGKSSIISELTALNTIKIGNVSAKGVGKHTTTSTQLYHMPDGGNLIDSPGVREFGLGNLSREEIAAGFIEFRDLISHCKFRDCNHFNEPQCAIKTAAKEGKIAKARLESYWQMLHGN